MNRTPIYIAMCYAIGSFGRHQPRSDISWRDYIRSGGRAQYIG